MTKEFCDFCDREIKNVRIGVTYFSEEPHKFLKKEICLKCCKKGIEFLKNIDKQKIYVTK